MIDEKKLIEDLSNSDITSFNMNFKTGSEKEILESLQEFADKMNKGFLNLIQAQPPVQNWISTAERLPEPFHPVLIHAPGDSPLPTVSEGYLTTDEFWISLYNEPYTMEEIKHWMPLPAPPDIGEQE